MHEILSLALLVLGYASPLDYSHFNLWIAWDRPSAGEKGTSISKQNVFLFHCGCLNTLSLQWCTTLFFFFLQTAWSSFTMVLMQAASTPELCHMQSGRSSAGRWGNRSASAPVPHHQKVNVALIADQWTNPSPTAQYSVKPPVSASSFRAPGQHLWAPLVLATTTAAFPGSWEGICHLSALAEGDHLAAAQHHQKLTCESPPCFSLEQPELGAKQISPALAQHVQPGCLLFADLLHQQRALVLMKPGCCNSLLA